MERLQVWLPATLPAGNDSGQVVHTHACVTKQYNLVQVIVQWSCLAGKVTAGLVERMQSTTGFVTVSPVRVWVSFLSRLIVNAVEAAVRSSSSEWRESGGRVWCVWSGHSVGWWWDGIRHRGPDTASTNCMSRPRAGATSRRHCTTARHEGGR